MSWENQIQTGSFKGVSFDVIATDDAMTRAVVEHQYPYVDGADIEDMGANAHEVTLSAIFFGDTYAVKLRALINVLQESGTGVLVHPIHGRLPDMLPISWAHHHEADLRNYVALTLTFKKSTQGNPVFANTSIFGEIDVLLAQIDALLERVQDIADQFYGAISTVSAFKSRFRAITSISANIISELKQSLNGVYAFSNSPQNQPNNGEPQGESNGELTGFNGLVNTLQSATTELFRAHDIADIITNEQRFNNMLTTATAIMELPCAIATKTNVNINANVMNDSELDHGVPTVLSDALELQVLVNTVVIGAATEFLANLINSSNSNNSNNSRNSNNSSNSSNSSNSNISLKNNNNRRLSPPEIEKMVNTLRLKSQVTIDLIRGGAFVTSSYDGFYSLIESMRGMQHQLKAIAIAAIATKPPLIARFAPFDGTLHQIAHAFYADFTRFDELLQLNPQLTHPSFITTGDLINGYTK